MSRTVRGFLLFALAFVVAGGVAAAIFIAVVLRELKPVEWDRPAPPTAAQLQTLRAAQGADVPTYWFGPAVRGKALSTARALDPSTPTGAPATDDKVVHTIFRYAFYCGEFDPGSGLDCVDEGSVDNGPRQIGSGTYLPRRAGCWHAHGAAWVIHCENLQDLQLMRAGADSEAPQLVTADRIVRFSIPTSTDNSYSQPWREVIRELRRFDTAPGARFPAAKRFTCREAVRAGARELRALPATLRPTSCPTQRS